jgi:hypothetical protein
MGSLTESSSPDAYAPVVRGRTLRRILAGVLVGVFALGAIASTVGLWADRTALRSGRFVETVRPFPRNPAINQALATFLTRELINELELTRRAEDALPDNLRFLVGPLDVIVRGYTRDAVADVLRSDQFQSIWVDEVRQAHEIALAVLSDEETEVVLVDGKVTLDLLPVVVGILQRALDAAPGFLGDITLPELDDAATRRELRAALEDAFDLNLPPDFGQVTVFDEDRLSEVQDYIYLVERALRPVVVGTILIGAAAIAISVDRRRTVLQLGLATAAGMAVLFFVLRVVIDDLVLLVPAGTYREAVSEAARLIARGLRGRAWFVLTLSLLVALGAYLGGPGRGAVWVRNAVRQRMVVPLAPADAQ